MTRRFNIFHLHGDNIVECERTVAQICLSLANVTQTVRGPFGIPVCPSYEIKLKDDDTPILLTLYPGFGRWNHDILELIRQRGGVLREAADIIITGVANSNETPLIAIEYCGALPAGNQAWQRSGRAYSFGKAKVPYLYIAELGGYELDADRVRKAARMPNPAVPFSYVSFSLTNETAALPVFVTSPGANETSRADYGNVFAETEFLTVLRSIILDCWDNKATEALKVKALSFVEKRAAGSRSGRTLTPEQWQKAYEALQNDQSLIDFLVLNARLPWSKVAYIKGLTPTARELMELTATLAIGLTSSDLPMCIIPRENRSSFCDSIVRLCEGRIQKDFINWLRQDKHLSVCWVMGFKPKGDDARPDRGLPPLTRMLVGEKADLLTVVYGPAPTSTWSHLHNNPNQLISNGLWQAILGVSDGILVDSSTDGIRQHGYLRSHWHQEQSTPNIDMIFVQPTPLRIGENDVDTILHLLFAHHAGNLIFEGMCNPPGGDWSGVSLQTIDRAQELRWLSLPRVSAIGGKRPDHVFQIFSSRRRPILLSIESKETAASVETGIGPRLTAYIRSLISTPASVERSVATTQWSHSTKELNCNLFDMASAVAFISDNQAQISEVEDRAETDFLICVTVMNSGEKCAVRLIPVTQLGAEIALVIAAIPLEGTGIEIVVDALQ